MKILQMTTYGVDFPDHGGKLRSHHIRKALRTTFDVQTLSFEWHDIENADSLSATLNKSRWSEFGIDGMLSDWGICTYLEKDEKFYARVCEHVRSYSPDVILLEQPFLWPLVERFLQDGVVSAATKVIYSSHNVEVVMKRKIYQDLYSSDLALHYTSYVDRIEQGVIKACSAGIAVSEKDANYINEISPETPVRVYLNGHSLLSSSPEDEKWRARFATQDKNWVFVGSWHPPNINGLSDLVSALAELEGGVGSMALWVLGSAGNGLLATVEGFCAENYPWLKIMGPVSSDDIESAILCSNGVVLPVWEGGGSNLKTAQALLSGKCVLGANFSFRGFEHCVDEPGVFLADDADRLASLMIDTNPADRYVRGDAVRALEWECVLKTLPGFVNEMFFLK